MLTTKRKPLSLYLAITLFLGFSISSCKNLFFNTHDLNKNIVAIKGARAHWLETKTLVWNTINKNIERYELHTSHNAKIKMTRSGLSGSEQRFILHDSAALTQSTRNKFRHLADWKALGLKIQAPDIQRVLQGQLIAVAYGPDNTLLEATHVQIPGVIDRLYEYQHELGVIIDEQDITLKLWAPTAQRVHLKRYDKNLSFIEKLEPTSTESGVLQFTGDRSWLDTFYRYEIKAYHPSSNKIETYEVTDPYSISLSQNSQFSQIVDLKNDKTLKPAGWDTLIKSLPEHKDISIYEAHIRDFSFSDTRVNKQHRGKYLALGYTGKTTLPLSYGVKHLKKLAKAGLSHFHLLPVNDIASINEKSEMTVAIDDSYQSLCQKSSSSSIQEYCDVFSDKTTLQVFEIFAKKNPLTEKIQAITHTQQGQDLASLDLFNWGYDPYHFLVPEGSYATEPHGKMRILEFRKMVKSLYEIGLHTVVDVVFNHTYSSGLQPHSVLDKVVPGYYHRRNPTSGKIETSTCCENTAAEHAMMEKLIIDSVKLWAEHYKIDAFRFDLMGHHPKSVLNNVKRALSELTPKRNGVQGSKIYLYGEGWDFGEVARNTRFIQATQFNMAGTYIGTFNDRLRDAVRGGNFSNNGRSQGFVNGNETYSNGVKSLSSAGDQSDQIRIGLAGNLQKYNFQDHRGNITQGVDYDSVAYNLDPQENVLYVDKHDNETLWDNTQAKLPVDLDMASRIRVHLLSQAFVNFGQGVPFHQMGTDILRSKSMDRDSYNSGDWFNQVDFSLQNHNWATGLPVAHKNAENWRHIKNIMSNNKIKPTPKDMALSTELFREQLQIRYSTPLFRLDTAKDVHQRIAFWNTGKTQIPGVIAMTISDGNCASNDLDSKLDGIAVIFNTDDEDITLKLDKLKDVLLELHPQQKRSSDDIAKRSHYQTSTTTFTLPPRTVAVFIALQTDTRYFPCNPHVHNA